ncbi:MAG: hypothetical protein JNK73_13165 [Bacteroidia bacterium]|nr:hypothetical protein [Bacteroidia bacterium]
MIKKEDNRAYERYLEKLDSIQRFNQVNLNESKTQRKARISRAKTDYAFFVSYYFPHYATCECAKFQVDAANYILRNKNCVDVEAWARGHAKSTHLDIMVPFWLWMNNELDVMLLVGKNEGDAKILLSDLQAEFEANPQILADFGTQQKVGSWEEGNFVTKNGVAFFSLGRGQSPRGVRYRNKRPNYIVCDDIDDDELIKNPLRVKKTVRWVLGALFNTMDNNGARMVFANNLIGVDTVVTNIAKRPNVRVNKINAIDENGKPSWPQKYTLSYFEERRSVIGDYAFQTEFMNNPQIEGDIFKDEQIQWAKFPPLKAFECIVGQWDVAYAGTPSSDTNAVKIWGLLEGSFYHIKAFVRHCKMADAIRFMIDYERKLPKDKDGHPTVRILWRFESQFWNDALKMTLQQVCDEEKYELSLIQCERPVNNKFVRIVSMQPYYQNGRVYYNKAEEFNLDMQVGINQLKSIEPGYNTHDDGPDADQAAIEFLSKFIPINSPLPLVGSRLKSAGAW